MNDIRAIWDDRGPEEALSASLTARSPFDQRGSLENPSDYKRFYLNENSSKLLARAVTKSKGSCFVPRRACHGSDLLRSIALVMNDRESVHVAFICAGLLDHVRIGGQDG